MAMDEVEEGGIWETIENGNEEKLEEKIEKGIRKIRKFNTTGTE